MEELMDQMEDISSQLREAREREDDAEVIQLEDRMTALAYQYRIQSKQ